MITTRGAHKMDKSKTSPTIGSSLKWLEQLFSTLVPLPLAPPSPPPAAESLDISRELRSDTAATRQNRAVAALAGFLRYTSRS